MKSYVLSNPILNDVTDKIYGSSLFINTNIIFSKVFFSNYTKKWPLITENYQILSNS